MVVPDTQIMAIIRPILLATFAGFRYPNMAIIQFTILATFKNPNKPISHLTILAIFAGSKSNHILPHNSGNMHWLVLDTQI